MDDCWDSWNNKRQRYSSITAINFKRNEETWNDFKMKRNAVVSKIRIEKNISMVLLMKIKVIHGNYGEILRRYSQEKTLTKLTSMGEFWQPSWEVQLSSINIFCINGIVKNISKLPNTNHSKHLGVVGDLETGITKEISLWRLVCNWKLFIKYGYLVPHKWWISGDMKNFNCS